MGTSSSFGGPKGRPSLLPPWADEDSVDNIQTDNEEEKDKSNETNSSETTEEDKLSGNYAGAKNSLSRYVNGGSGSSVRNASKSYVRSLGGAKKATRSSSSGKRAVSAFGGFLGNVARDGINQTLRNLGLGDLIGESASVVFAGIVDAIAPTGTSNEEADARQAIVDALNMLYDKYELADDNLSKLDALNATDIREAILDSVKAYIYERWLQELSLCIEKHSLTPGEATRKETEMKEHIKAAVDYDFEDQDVLNMDFAEGSGKELIENIFYEAYQTLES
ncbi:hypothetical protein GCM10009122_33160 [Fulvivirga kasyanovii]|uniref:Uncharacterized protein n=1 Tax=Fulvivirga kasyanovii TaxID=396812 RepID=A0ABW9RUE3_9BACT|nr:Qat anti-phage system associated protein QatB [Fulvivirga kasyanovii]MBT31791.1 hypothetical protein [Thalassovita sp.]MTI27818.1 hypothetical protein [Fulvivirga kasyanovii]HNP17030.1 hypothetical protein [Fulvivirga sp.]